MRRLGVVVRLALVALLAACGGDGAAAKGDAELAAITVPADWKLTSTTFEPGGMNEPDNHWIRWYHSPARGADALRAYDTAVRAAGWSPDSSCVLGNGHGCWYKPGYRLTANAGEGSGCQPSAEICALIEVRLSDG